MQYPFGPTCVAKGEIIALYAGEGAFGNCCACLAWLQQWKRNVSRRRGHGDLRSGSRYVMRTLNLVWSPVFSCVEARSPRRPNGKRLSVGRPETKRFLVRNSGQRSRGRRTTHTFCRNGWVSTGSRLPFFFCTSFLSFPSPKLQPLLLLAPGYRDGAQPHATLLLLVPLY
jgi:hypothetical protein